MLVLAVIVSCPEAADDAAAATAVVFVEVAVAETVLGKLLLGC